MSHKTPVDGKALRDQLIRDEGIRLTAYSDSRGNLTIGVGRLIQSPGGITHDEAIKLLDNDIVRVAHQCKDNIDFWDSLDESRRRALANMTFQLGIDGLLEFKHMLAALKAGNWQEAHDQAIDSKWAQETPERAHRIANMLLHG